MDANEAREMSFDYMNSTSDVKVSLSHCVSPREQLTVSLSLSPRVYRHDARVNKSLQRIKERHRRSSRAFCPVVILTATYTANTTTAVSLVYIKDNGI